MTEKTEFQKLGANSLKVYQKNGRWVFDHKGTAYDMAPAGMTDYALDPTVVGADRLIVAGCRLKGIPSPESGFTLIFSEGYFPNSDVVFSYLEPKFNGWVYRVEEMNLKGLMLGQRAWICPYMGFYFGQPPSTLYLKMEPIDESPLR